MPTNIVRNLNYAFYIIVYTHIYKHWNLKKRAKCGSRTMHEILKQSRVVTTNFIQIDHFIYNQNSLFYPKKESAGCIVKFNFYPDNSTLRKKFFQFIKSGLLGQLFFELEQFIPAGRARGVLTPNIWKYKSDVFPF